MEVLLLLIFVVVVVLPVAFCVWLVATVLRAIKRALRPKRRGGTDGVGRQVCVNGDCRCDSPAHARFCRRCGRPLPALMRLVKARAA